MKLHIKEESKLIIVRLITLKHLIINFFTILRIIEYESWCGGLPSPEFVDNPLGYKFTWSPIGAIGALRNDAKFLENGEVT
jgi:saccharopine dehydrogenase-like NADP-dependent oxidoreductase